MLTLAEVTNINVSPFMKIYNLNKSQNMYLEVLLYTTFVLPFCISQLTYVSFLFYSFTRIFFIFEPECLQLNACNHDFPVIYHVIESLNILRSSNLDSQGLQNNMFPTTLQHFTRVHMINFNFL